MGIPRMCLGLSGGKDNSTRLLGNYWYIWKDIISGNYRSKALMKLRIYLHILTHPFQKVKPMTMAHSFVVIGGNSDLVIEAKGSILNFLLFKLPWGQIGTSNLRYFLTKDRWFVLYANNKIDADKAEAFARGSIGVLYDLGLVKGFIDWEKIYDDPLSQNCVQNSVKIMRYGGAPLLQGIDDSKIHPMQIKEYCDKEMFGWYKVCEWDGNTLKEYKNFDKSILSS